MVGGGHVRMAAVNVARPSIAPGIFEAHTTSGTVYVEGAVWAAAIAAEEAARIAQAESKR